MSTLVALQVKVSTVNNLALAFDFALDGQRESEEVASCLTSIIATVRELDDLVLRLAGDGGGDIARRAIAAAVSTLEDTLNGGDYGRLDSQYRSEKAHALTYIYTRAH